MGTGYTQAQLTRLSGTTSHDAKLKIFNHLVLSGIAVRTCSLPKDPIRLVAWTMIADAARIFKLDPACMAQYADSAWHVSSWSASIGQQVEIWMADEPHAHLGTIAKMLRLARLLLERGNVQEARAMVERGLPVSGPLRQTLLETLKAIETASQLGDDALEMTDQDMLSAFGLGYGIYTGQPLERALLLFSPERARWVQQEEWHRDQVGKLLPDGHYQLEVPYTDERELVADLLGYGSSVKVLRPASLVKSLTAALEAAMGNYP